MKIKLITIGKTDESYLREGIDKYLSRLKHYVNFEIILIPDVKNSNKLAVAAQKEMEGKEILKKIKNSDFVMLLDEKGKEFSSVNFSSFLQKRMNVGADIVFVIGGPFGFSDEVYTRGDSKLALSKMTFSHQMIRLFFTEQLYRAFTILKREKYHHD